MDYNFFYYIFDLIYKYLLVKYYYKGIYNNNILILDNKNLHYIPNIIPFATKTISLDSNKIKNIPEDLLHGIKNIYLCNNIITFIHHDLPLTLRQLWIINNPIYMISDRFKVKLKGIDLNNLLKTIEETDTDTLQIVGLNNSQVKRCQKVYKLMILIKKTWIIIQLQRRYKNYLYSPEFEYGKKLIKNGENKLQEYIKK